jgi:hypothetical protein
VACSKVATPPTPAPFGRPVSTWVPSSQTLTLEPASYVRISECVSPRRRYTRNDRLTHARGQDQQVAPAGAVYLDHRHAAERRRHRGSDQAIQQMFADAVVASPLRRNIEDRGYHKTVAGPPTIMNSTLPELTVPLWPFA